MLGVTTHAAVAAVLQTTTPPGVGPDELVDYWPTLVRWGWFLVGVLATVILARVFVEPALARVVRRRNRNNPTLSEAVLLYARVVVS